MENFTESETSSIGRIKDRLEKLNETFHIFAPMVKVRNFNFDLQNPPDQELIKEVGYMTFVHRLAANTRSIQLLINSIDKKSFGLTEHSIGILIRANLLDSIYIIAWIKKKDIITCYLAESFQKLASTNEWHATTNQAELLKKSAQHFKGSCKYKTSIRELRKIIVDHQFANAYFLCYDYYSKYDHFGISLGSYFDASVTSRLVKLNISLQLVSMAISSLFQQFHDNEEEKKQLVDSFPPLFNDIEQIVMGK